MTPAEVLRAIQVTGILFVAFLLLLAWRVWEHEKKEKEPI